MDTSTQALQVRGRERRRFRTVEEKRRIVEAALEPGASVARVARAYGVNANQLFGWRRLYFTWKAGSSPKTGKRLVCWRCAWCRKPREGATPRQGAARFRSN